MLLLNIIIIKLRKYTNLLKKFMEKTSKEGSALVKKSLLRPPNKQSREPCHKVEESGEVPHDICRDVSFKYPEPGIGLRDPFCIAVITNF